MIWFKLAWLSLRARSRILSLTVLSVAISIALLFAIEKVTKSSEQSFLGAISDVDLLVGGRSSPINLVLYNIFNLGQATNNVSWETYSQFKNHPAVAWATPFMLGDSHRGFRVVGTDSVFFEHYRFGAKQGLQLQQGQIFQGVWEAVLGAKVAEELEYSLGTPMSIAHGVTRGEGVQIHEETPFTVVGILKPTGTVLDQSIYISVQGFEALHFHWADGYFQPEQGQAQVAAKDLKLSDVQISSITSFFIRTKNRIEVLGLQREINTYENEPLMAVLPQATLQQLWRNLGSFELVLKVITSLVLLTSLLGLLVILILTLGERRREMSIFRSLGAGPGQIHFFLIFDATAIVVLGVLGGFGIQALGFVFLKPWLWESYGVTVVTEGAWWTLSFYLLIYLLVASVLGYLVGLAARSQALKDGLSQLRA